MRLRNIPGARDILTESPFVIKEPAQWKGRWRELFENQNPVRMEIGMGKGRFLFELAASHPEYNYIGIERYSSVLLRAVQKAEEIPLPNLRFLCEDALNLPDFFASEEVQRIYLNFSDPWPKERHAKRRLTSSRFLSCYETFLKQDGLLEFKTDNRPLFDFSLESIPEAGWQIVDYTFDLHHSPLCQGNVMTEYEERFSSMGHPIYKLIACRRQA